MAERPNVLIILSDQHNAKCLGAAGHSIVKTPNLDRLAAEGVFFTNAIAQSTICTPSRVSFFSGQYPHNHGRYGNDSPAPRALPSYMGHFRNQGYCTGAVGITIDCRDDWIQPDCDFFRPLSAAAHASKEPDYESYLSSKGLLDQRDDQYFPEQHDRTRSPKDSRPSRLAYPDSIEAWCVGEVRRFVENCGMRSWIMQVALQSPHQPYAPAREFWELYPDDIPMPTNADIDMSLKPPHMRRMLDAQRSGQDEFIFEPKTYEGLRRRKLRGYFGMISQVDHAVGELLQFLRLKGIEEDTIVIYSADHGEYACEFGLLEKAPGICSDAVTRIPSIWRWPNRIAAGHVTERIVESVDLAPTISCLAGLGNFPTADGSDLTPLLKGEDVELHCVGVTENPWSKSIRKGDWRLVHYPREMFASESPDYPVGELYNLTEDPWEVNNLFYSPAHWPKVEELRAELFDWYITTSRVVTCHPTLPSPLADGKISAAHLRELNRKGLRDYL